MTDTTPTPADRPADQLRAAAECAPGPELATLLTVLADASDHHGPGEGGIVATLVHPALAVARQLLGTSAAEGAAETDEEREQREDREATARNHAAGEHQHCGITCEVELPTEHLRNFVIAKGYPGTAGALDELLRRAAAPPAPADRAATRDRIADALAAADGWEWGPGHDSLTSSVIGRYLRRADAVLAVLADGAAAGVQPPTTTADRAAALGMTPTEYRQHSHNTAVQQIQAAAQGLFAGTAIRVADALKEPDESEAEIRRLGDMVTQYGHGASALTDKLRRVRDAHRETCPLATGAITVGFSCGMCELLDAPAMPVEPTEPPTHLPKGTNAEDCPACKGTNPDYPFLCPGPPAAPAAPEEPTPC
ncbi:hypothetical protein R1Y80_00905 [Streptomyces sp. JL1001]|uniref:Uncharacterized protein n=1 Tax=Streptomyces sp. JL1001 TaxID=3078227 RepID=A0AAU8K969_9ACTN